MDRSGFHDVLKVLPFHRKGSAIAHEHWEIVESFLMSVILGAGNCSGSAQLSYDEVIRDTLGWEKAMPSQSSLSRFIRKYAENHSDLIFSELQRWWFAQIPDGTIVALKASIGCFMRILTLFPIYEPVIALQSNPTANYVLAVGLQ